MTAFGGPVSLFGGDGDDLVSAASPEEDVARVRATLEGLRTGGPGRLRIFRPRPTAAFAPRDLLLPAYPEAAEAVRGLGFTPVERCAGGQLALYDETALVIDLIAPHADPRPQVIERFRDFAAAIAASLRSFGIDSRIGAIAGEYCPGDYSVNARGAVKLVGVAQRVSRRGYHLGAVIAVAPSPNVVAATARAYKILAVPFAVNSFGTVQQEAQGLDFTTLHRSLASEFGRLLPVISKDC